MLIHLFHHDAFYHACTNYKHFLAVLYAFTICTISWYCFLLPKGVIIFWKMIYDRVRSIIMIVILISVDSVVVFLYLTLHLECFEVKGICFLFLIICFVKMVVFAFFRIQFITFVWSFFRLIFQSDYSSTSLSHLCQALVCCFPLLAFQSLI